MAFLQIRIIISAVQNKMVMKIKDYNSGIWKQQYEYKSFSPAGINHSWEIDNEKLNFFLSLTNIKLGELNAWSMLIPDIDFFIRMHIKKYLQPGEIH